MSVTKNYTFNTASNYTYDSDKIVISNGTAELIDTLGVYPTDNPTITLNDTLSMDDLEFFTETSTISGSDAIKYTLSKDGVEYYFSGTWVISDGTYAQSNTAAEIETNKATFTTTGVITGIKIFLHSDDSSTTPSISNLLVTYNFITLPVETIPTTLLWWYGKQNDATDDDTTATIALTNNVVKYGSNTTITSKSITITPTTGTYEVDIINTAGMQTDINGKEQTYTLTINGESYLLNIPNKSAVNLYDTGIILRSQ